MRLPKFEKLSAWDVAYAVDMAIACLITYWLMTLVVSPLTHESTKLVGVLWAQIATIWVFRDTRAQSLSAGMTRLIATGVSFALCFCYLSLFPFTPLGLMALLVFGTLLMMASGRRDEISLTAVTTAVIMVVAAGEAHEPWLQPLHRLVDTLIGVSVGIACKWVASFLFYRIAGEEVR
jgi:uncharacterized membrane protein YgaE (UPF0421/DUF939 family)